MAKLTAAGRNKIAGKNFALAGRRYPIEDASHARNALARVAQHGSPAEKAEVRAKVHRKYPAIGRAKNPHGNPGHHPSTDGYHHDGYTHTSNDR